MKFLASDEFQYTYSKKSSDLICNISAIQRLIKEHAKINFIVNTNAYEILFNIAMGIKDPHIFPNRTLFGNAIVSNAALYYEGGKTKEQAIERLKKNLKIYFPKYTWE